MTFTVAIPTHDRRETVALAVRSVLAQTRPPERLIVLCDGCTDDSVAALRAIGDERLDVRDLPKLPGYGYAHRNTVLDDARGGVVVWMGDDDLLLPDHLERLGEYWDMGGADIVTSPAVVVRPDDTLEWIGEDWSVPATRAGVADANTNVMASVSVRADLAREVGGWDPAVPRAADWDLWSRCLATGAVAWSTVEPTVLHFRATGREQAWPDRVRQNTEWLNRLGDSDGLAAMRRELRRTRGVRDAERVSEIVFARDGWGQAIAGRDVAVAYAQSLEDERERLRGA